MKHAKAAEIASAYIAAYNACDIDGMIDLLDEDVTFRNISAGKVTHECVGIEAFRSLAEQGAAAFSERHQEILAITGADAGEVGMLCVDIRFRGKFAKDIDDGPATGGLMELEGRTEFKFRGDKILEIHDYS
jgi:hypothetical protein